MKDLFNKITDKTKDIVNDNQDIINGVKEFNSSAKDKLAQNKENKTNKKIEKIEAKKTLEANRHSKRYGLEEVNINDLEIINKIKSDLAGNGILKAGMTFGGNAVEVSKITYMSAQVEQNWLIYNQLTRLNNNMEKLIDIFGEDEE